MASQAATMRPRSTASLGSSPAPQVNADAASKPKPCCVCKDEKARRDECMLFSTAADPAKDCQSMVQQYRSCMEGFGFKV